MPSRSISACGSTATQPRIRFNAVVEDGQAGAILHVLRYLRASGHLIMR